MAARPADPVAPRPPINAQETRAGLLKLYATRKSHSPNPLSDPQYQYISIALIVSSAALAIFGNALTCMMGLALLGVLFLGFSHIYDLPDHYKEHNHKIDTIMGMLWVPGFIEYCSQNRKPLYPEGNGESAADSFRRAAIRAGSASPRRP